MVKTSGVRFVKTPWTGVLLDQAFLVMTRQLFGGNVIMLFIYNALIDGWGQIILVLYAGASGSFKKQIMASKARTPLLNNGLFDGTMLLIYREMCNSFTNCTLIQDAQTTKAIELIHPGEKTCAIQMYRPTI